MRCIYVVTVEVSHAAEQAWSGWHSGVHVPEVLAQPGFVGARKLRDAELTEDGRARYVVEYSLENREAFDRYTKSEAAARLRKDHEDRFGKVVRTSRQVLEELEVW